jgi:transposase
MDRHSLQPQWDGRPHLYNRHRCAKVWGVFNNPRKREGASSMKVTTIGLDLAKDVFQVCAADASGKILYNKQLRRNQMTEFFTKLPACLIGMEACGSAHYWARKLLAMGHDVKLMPPQYVKPYVKTHKNDAVDAAAICEAVTRPNMRFVAVKSEEQQALLALHRVRQGFVRDRTAHSNQIRGELAEFGLIVPKGLSALRKRVPVLLEDTLIPGPFAQLLQRLLDEVLRLDEQIKLLERDIALWHRSSELSKRLAQIPGVGPLTASALLCSIGDISYFKNARQLPAWLGLVPRQHSSGGRNTLLGITKRGDCYLRTLLIHGARSAILAAQRKPIDPEHPSWLQRLLARAHPNIAAVALANKNARVAWALLAKHQDYKLGYDPRLQSLPMAQAA